MEYVQKCITGVTRIRILDNRVEVECKERFVPLEKHTLNRSFLSTSTVSCTRRDRGITALIQLGFLAAFILTAVAAAATSTLNGFIWALLFVLVAGMFLGPLAATKRRVFSVYCTGSSAMLSVLENPGKQGAEEFDRFVEELNRWLNSGEKTETGEHGSGNAI